jgi:two-component system phosphate regulon sensor histidine kinase PhoR
MFVHKLQIQLPRRITAYFLLFGLAALVWLSVGAVYVARSVTDSRSESGSLRAVGRGSSRLALAYLRDKTANLQPLLAEIRAESGADYCAVVSPAGQYLGHSARADLVGKPAVERGGITDRWGDVVRVQYIDEGGLPIHEYQAPLKAGAVEWGSLRLGISQPTLWTYLRASGRAAPLAFIGPACCMAVGAVLLNRLVRPVADIERQLHEVAMSPSLEGCQLHEVATTGAAARGWNRVIQQRFRSSQADALGERIRQSLDSSRQSRLDAVLNSVPDGVATTDGTGRLTYTNLPMAVILGLKDVVGSQNQENQPPVFMKDQLAKRWQLTDEEGLFSDENRDRPVVTELAREENGQRRVARVARHPICIVGSGKHETHVWTMRDVTQQKLAEEMRDQFVDTATHELRTPLANIKAYAETLALADVIDIEQQKQFLNTINSEATRLARFVDDLLSVSSMELGSLSLNKQVTDLARMLNEVLTKVRPQIEEKRLTFDVVLPEKMPEPEVDKDKIATVLVNLLGNAVKYTPSGGRVTFRVNITDQQIEISVEDTGVGIAEHELPKVFEKFYRSQDPRVQEQTGTGLGLALAQEVVRLHGGRITVESELDKGSTFSVVLPLG